MQNSGIDPKNGVTWKTYDSDVLSTAAEKGQVDAIGTVDPYAYQAIKEKNFRIIIDNNNHEGSTKMEKMGMKKDASCCYLYLSDKLTKQNPKKAKAIVKAYQEAADWINHHPKETASILLKKDYVSSSKFVNEENVGNLIADYHFGLKKSQGKSDVKFYAQQLKKAGFLKSDTNVDQLVEHAYYEK